MPSFGQIVIGPPGSGKTTYCAGVQEVLKSLGRDVIVVNVDPANDTEPLPYTCTINLRDLITVEDTMAPPLNLGPNGGLVYCMEYLESNLSWLSERLEAARSPKGQQYFLFDLPGQVELFTHHRAVQNLVKFLTSELDFRLTCVNLVDSHYCSDPGKFVAVALTSLTAMLQLALPHVNVLSKVDLAEVAGKLPFSLEYFTDVLDLSYMTDLLSDDPFMKKYKKLNESLCGVIEDYSLVNFLTLNVKDKESVLRVVRHADRANGHCFGEQAEMKDVMKMMTSVMDDGDTDYFRSGGDSERYLGTHREHEELDDINGTPEVMENT